MKKKTALITGATGFVGSHLVRNLLDQGWAVHAIVRPRSNKKVLVPFGNEIKLHVYDGSFNSLAQTIKKSRPDVVFHLASLFLAEHSSSDIDPLFESNLVFSTKLVEAMVQHRVWRLINVGTAWQHYQNESYNPVCLYAATKQAFEAILRYYVESSRLKVTTLKLFDTYGPNDPRNKLISVMQKSLRSHQHLKMSPGFQKIDLVYIDDVVEGLILAAKRQLQGKSGKWDVFSINTHKPLTLRGIVALFGKAAGHKPGVIWGGRSYRQREVMNPWKGTRWVPGWRPKVGLLEGFKRMGAGS